MMNLKKINKKEDKCEIKERRKNEIENMIREYKLDNLKPSLCLAYIKYGLPKIDDIILSFKKEQDTKDERLLNLMAELKRRGLNYDENVPIYEEYIKRGGNLKKIIKEGKLESLLIYNTKYKQYLKHNNIQMARYLATIEFMNSGKKNDIITNFANKNNTIKFC